MYDSCNVIQRMHRQHTFTICNADTPDWHPLTQQSTKKQQWQLQADQLKACTDEQQWQHLLYICA